MDVKMMMMMNIATIPNTRNMSTNAECFNKVCHCGLAGSARTWNGTGCEFDSWQCQIYIPCSLSLRLSPMGFSGYIWLDTKIVLKNKEHKEIGEITKKNKKIVYKMFISWSCTEGFQSGNNKIGQGQTLEDSKYPQFRQIWNERNVDFNACQELHSQKFQQKKLSQY